MKKVFLSSLVITFLFFSISKACSWYDPDYEYFNLFTQSIIKDKTYLPFLLTYSNAFYGHQHYEIADDNIENWQKYFGNKLNYQETKTLVEQLPMADLNVYKKTGSGNPILAKLGTYQNYREGIDYLIEAKYLQPYMKINYVESPDSFYYREVENDKNAMLLPYDKTIAALTSLYNATKNPEIKLRYGYQIVRFNHYTRNYQKAIESFKNYVAPLKIKSSPYYLALDQLAGAQRGLKQNSEANWNFFQVFINSKSKKESAFTSMKLSDSASFNNILKRAQTNEEKNMAYFLLGYQDYANPIPMMEKMYDLDPNSEILKVLAARSINELERNYLPIYYENKEATALSPISKNEIEPNLTKSSQEQQGLWNKIVSFFRNIFNSDSKKSDENGNNKSDDKLLDNPNRIPFFTDNTLGEEDKKTANYLNDFEKFTEKAKENSNDEFWQITNAYLQFLKKDYRKSNEILAEIKTTNPEYLAQIDRMKMLNDIVSQPKINSDFEEHLMKTYPKLFLDEPKEKNEQEDNYVENYPSTKDFITDILANRYFLQGDYGKSFLMSNTFSDLQYSPNYELAKNIEDFYKKPNKTSFEKEIILKKMDDVGNVEAFFNLIYGDREMRLAHFENAKNFYSKSLGFKGIPRNENAWNENETQQNKGASYDGFRNISSLIFGHNVWESYQSPANVSMKSENFSEFPFIKNTMNKLELAETLIILKKLGNGNNETASKANQLIGNVLYNTSILGYFREVFVMDIDNSNGGKYNFWNTEETPYQIYYKNYSYHPYIDPDRFDLSISYYQKALNTSKDREQKARILFQMASAEQGKYYQNKAKNAFNIAYDDPNYSQKEDAYQQKMNQIKNQNYRTYFSMLKENYKDTKTSQMLMGSCTYYEYFLEK